MQATVSLDQSTICGFLPPASGAPSAAVGVVPEGHGKAFVELIGCTLADSSFGFYSSANAYVVVNGQDPITSASSAVGSKSNDRTTTTEEASCQFRNTGTAPPQERDARRQGGTSGTSSQGRSCGK